MQETHSTRKAENIWTNQWGCGKGSVYFSLGSSDSRGTLIAFREGMDYTTEKSVLDQEGRYAIRQAKIQDSSIILINYYAPNVEWAQITVLSEINDIINNLVLEENTTILWGDDFNSFFDVKLKKVKTLALEITAESSEELLEEYHTYKNELESIYNYITEGIILDAKVDRYEHGEKSTKYFLNLEKPNLRSGKL